LCRLEVFRFEKTSEKCLRPITRCTLGPGSSNFGKPVIYCSGLGPLCRLEEFRFGITNEKRFGFGLGSLLYAGEFRSFCRLGCSDLGRPLQMVLGKSWKWKIICSAICRSPICRSIAVVSSCCRKRPSVWSLQGKRNAFRMDDSASGRTISQSLFLLYSGFPVPIEH